MRAGLYIPETAREQAHLLLAQPDRPTAVFAANDLSAIAVMEAGAALGLRVPEDLSVIGFDDVPEAFRVVPALTTVRQPMRRLGALAAEFVTAQLAGQRPDPLHVQLPTRLVVRGTTAPPA